MAEEKKAEVTDDIIEDVVADKDKEILKLTEERDNYKNVALKRLGKLPGDEGFVAGVDEKTGLTIEETVRKTLIEDKLIKAEEERKSETAKIIKENAELRLALKNQPDKSLGGAGGGDDLEVKDNVFSEAQLVDLRKRAVMLKADPEKFIADAKKNFLARR